MKHAFCLIAFCSLCLSGKTQVRKEAIFLFDFDSTKIFVAVSFITSVLTEDNLEMKDNRIFKSLGDTIKLEEYRLSLPDSTNSVVTYSLNKELFKAINENKAQLFFYGNLIPKFYFKKFGSKRKRLIYRNYYDKTNRQCFLSEMIYIRHYCGPGHF